MIRYECYDPDNGDPDDTQIIETHFADDAAAKYAEKIDCLNGGEYTERRFIMVRQVGNSNWTKFRVLAEPDIRYSSRIVPNDDEKP